MEEIISDNMVRDVVMMSALNVVTVPHEMRILILVSLFIVSKLKKQNISQRFHGCWWQSPTELHILQTAEEEEEEEEEDEVCKDVQEAYHQMEVNLM